MFFQEITPQDIGLSLKDDIQYTTRHTARGIITNEEGNIAVLNVWKDTFYMLPGGGVDDNESLLSGLQREIHEEVGAHIKDISFFGLSVSYRQEIARKNIDSFFLAHVDGALQQPHLMEDERSVGTTCVRMSPQDAYNAIALWDVTTIGDISGEDHEDTLLIQKRDSAVLQSYLEYLAEKKLQAGPSHKEKEYEEIAKKAQYDYIMLKSEFDSYVRRMQAEQQEGKTTYLIDAIKKMLPIIEHLEQSVDHIPTDLQDNTWVAGVKLTADNAEKLLQSRGVSRIPTIGEEPDIHCHEPLGVEPVEDETQKGKIIKEYQAGYVYEKDGVRTVITPAKVIVGQ